MTDRKILAIKNSWSYLRANSPDAGAVFYQKLFGLDPSLRTLFNSDLAHQTRKLMDMLTLMIVNLQSPEAIAGELSALARRHAGYGVRPAHYPLVGQALLWTLEQELGEHWNEEISDAWRELYESWANGMLEAGS